MGRYGDSEKPEMAWMTFIVGLVCVPVITSPSTGSPLPEQSKTERSAIISA